MRMLARVLPLGLVAVMLSAPGATPVAVAATVEVQMLATTYSPSVRTVGQGGYVKWINGSGVAHTATSDQGFFNSPQLTGNGDSATLPFEHAGSFGYHSQELTTMHGTVKVPLKAPAAAANGFTLRWSAVGSYLPGRTFDVQKKKPGTTTWTWLRSNTTARYAFLNPTRNGTWRYRARTDNTSNGLHSGWSPVKLVKVS
jgi:plastocyanin